MTRCNSTPLHLQWIERKKERKKVGRKEKCLYTYLVSLLQFSETFLEDLWTKVEKDLPNVRTWERVFPYSGQAEQVLVSRPALGPTQPPRQCVQRALSPGRQVTTHPLLLPKLGKSGAIGLPLHPHTYSWIAHAQLYHYFSLCVLRARNNVKWEQYSIMRAEFLFYRVWSDVIRLNGCFV